jgi:hypothetical protein
MAFPNERQQSLGRNKEFRSLPTMPFHPTSPLPLSASNYVNQNVFPSIFSFSTSHPLNPDTFPTQFHPLHPQNTAYIQQNQQNQQNHHQYQHHPPFIHRNPFPLHLHSYLIHYPAYFPDHQSLRPPPHPLAPPLAPDHFIDPTSFSSVPVVSSSTRSLPTVSHIPLLSGRTDFGAWNNGVRTLLLHLGCLGHISDPPAGGYAALPDQIPTYPPLLSVSSTPPEFSDYKFWWEQDNVASHVLLSCLSSVVRSLLPYDNSDPVSPHTSHIIYDILQETYGLCGYVSGSALYSELRALPCGPRILEFVTKWRSGVSQL